MNNTIRRILITALALAMGGCSSIQSGANDIKAAAVDPAPDVGFIQHPKRQAKRTDLPFQ